MQKTKHLTKQKFFSRFHDHFQKNHSLPYIKYRKYHQINHQYQTYLGVHQILEIYIIKAILKRYFFFLNLHYCYYYSNYYFDSFPFILITNHLHPLPHYNFHFNLYYCLLHLYYFMKIRLYFLRIVTYFRYFQYQLKLNLNLNLLLYFDSTLFFTKQIKFYFQLNKIILDLCTSNSNLD